ncbi:MAG: GTPase Era [Ruminococcaceae bacterium]|nr:GTPase Era [Oscillospiraceae bacterium]
MAQKTVFITIAGKPNVGKSTLLNSLLGEKVAIVSKKPQTTRTRITGILTEGENQYVFTDTPGLHKPKNLLGQYMMNVAGNATVDADIIFFVVDVSNGPVSENEKDTLRKITKSSPNVFLIINKVDRTNKTDIAKTISELAGDMDFKSVIPISALTGEGVDIILKEVNPFLVESPHFFPDDIYTDQPERQIIAEVIREKILRLMEDEIPHGVAVVVEEFKEKKNALFIRAEIYCEKEAHKRIIIGKNGAMLKKIGMYAREDAEKLFGASIYLDLWVKVKENWRERQSLVSNFGYNDANE